MIKEGESCNSWQEDQINPRFCRKCWHDFKSHLEKQENEMEKLTPQTVTLDPMTPAQILGGVDAGVLDLIVVGEHEDNKLWFSSTTSDLAHVLVLLERAKAQVMGMIENPLNDA